MGFNTGILVMNDGIDRLDDIDTLADWWMRVKNAIASGKVVSGEPDEISIGSHVNASRVFHMEHSGVTGIYAIGGNYTTRLGTRNYWSHHTNEDKEAIMRELANELGFTLIKKPK